MLMEHSFYERRRREVECVCNGILLNSALAMDLSTRHIALAYRHAICLVIVSSLFFINFFYHFNCVGIVWV